MRGFKPLPGILGACLVAVLLLAAAVARAAPPTPATPTSHVTDEAGVLSTAARAALARRLDHYEQASGHQVIVWIGPSASDEPVEEFAVRAFEAWTIGRAGLDDGLALFVLVEDRAVRVEVGYGLEPIVTDLAASRVIHETMIPRLRVGDWDGAVVAGTERLVDTIEGAPGSLPGDADGPPRSAEFETWKLVATGIAVLVMLILFVTNPRLALMLLMFLGRRGGGIGGGGPGGGGFGGGGGRSGGGGATGHW